MSGYTSPVSILRRKVETMPYSVVGDAINAGSIDLGANTLLDNSAWSFAAWIKPQTTNARLFSYAFNFGANKGYLIRFSSAVNLNAPSVFAGSSSFAFNGSPNARFPLNQWNHIAITFDGVSTWTLYRNFVVIDVQTSATPRTADTTNTHTLLMSEQPSTTGMGVLGIREALVINRALSASEVYLLSTEIFPKDVLCFYKCDEGSGTTIANSSGVLPAGVFNGALTWSPDAPTKARKIASNRKIATVPKPNTNYIYSIGDSQATQIIPINVNSILLDNINDFTCGAYVNLISKTAPGNNDDHCILNCNLSFGSNTGYAFYVGSSGDVSMVMGNSFVQSSVGLFTFNVWHWVVFTLTGTTFTVYIDGVSVYTTTTPARVVAGNGTVHTFYSETGGQIANRTCYGNLKDAFSAKRLLSQAEITGINNGVFPSLGTTGIHYKCDEGAGTAVLDYSGNGNNGYSGGTILWEHMGRSII